MEKQIPTVEIEIEGEKVLLYQWLTQEEEDRLNEIVLGDVDIEASTQNITLTAKKLSEMNRVLIESICKSHEFEIVNQWKPSKRKILIDEINNVRSKN